MNTNPLGGHDVGSSVSGLAMITSALIRQSNNHNEYVRWEGLDYNADKIQGTYFGPNNNPPKLQIGGVYEVSGSIGQSRNKSLDIWANNMVLVEDASVVAEFKGRCYPSVPEDRLNMVMNTLQTYCDSIQEQGLKALAHLILNHYKSELLTLPAGKTVHDARRGGLAEHTYEVLTILNNGLFVSKSLDFDVLFFSGLLHDIGKVRCYTNELQMSEQGRFVPHIVESIKIVTEFRIANSIVIPDKKLWHVEHCISSHHGKEHSPVNPSSREALALHFSDYMVSSIAHVDTFILDSEVGEDGWTPYSKILGGSAYIPNLDVS